MFLTSSGIVVLDYDLNLLTEILGVIDRQLEVVLAGWADMTEADESGYFDRIEHATGLGFVACQAYLTTTYGYLKIEKSKALAAGPCHRTGLGIASLINHAANFWKHQGEWGLDKGAARQAKTRQAFDEVGYPVDLDYPLSGILTGLATPCPASFKPLIPLLERWRDELRAIREP